MNQPRTNSHLKLYYIIHPQEDNIFPGFPTLKIISVVENNACV
jgi:hypothetical protein